MSGYFPKFEPQHSPFIKRELSDQFDTWMNDYHGYRQDDQIKKERPSGFSDPNLKMFDDDAMEDSGRENVSKELANGMTPITHCDDAMEDDAGENDLSAYQDQTNGMDYKPYALYQNMPQYDQPTSSSATIPVDLNDPSSEYPSMSAEEASTILDAEIDTDIDTTHLCYELSIELKTRGIGQSEFAEKVLGRSQGTLSDLLKNPKPWISMKPHGKSTYRRMYNWLRQPLITQRALLNVNTDVSRTPVQSARKQRKLSPSEHDEPSSKRARHVFTEFQRRTLKTLFEEERKPSREMKQAIADHLRLDLDTVVNFFSNSRRRVNRNKKLEAYQQENVENMEFYD